jgi:hypothetical protein
LWFTFCASSERPGTAKKAIGGPGGDLISELHLRTDNNAVPGNHLVEMAGFDGHVVKLRLDHRAYLFLQAPVPV